MTLHALLFLFASQLGVDVRVGDGLAEEDVPGV
jgi:hypothetical protein